MASEDKTNRGNGFRTKYYAQNLEKIRENARVYSARMRSDPVKRKQINAQKREAMRRLNERRKAEKDKRERLLVACAAANTLTEQSAPSQVELQDIVHQYENCIEDWDNQRSTHEDLPTFQESYQPTEPQVVMKTEISTSQELSPVDGQAQNDFFPFASGIANCLEGEDLRKFISYIEDSAQMYLKHSNCLSRVVDKTRLSDLILRRP